MDLRKLTAVELAAKIKAKEVTVAQAAQAVFDCIGEREKLYHCYVTVDRDGAIAQTKKLF